MHGSLLPRFAHRLPGWAGPVAVGAVVATATVTLGVMDPEVRSHLSPGCPFRTVTGLDCPGCGGTRAVYALTQGQIGTALEHNLLVVSLLPLLVVAWGAWLRYRLGWRTQPLVLRPAIGYGIAAAFGLFWIVRNLPWAPLQWLGSGVG
jgi:hypothetical protein